MPLPEAMTDEGDVFAAGPILVGGEIPPEHRFEAERGQERCRRIETDHLFRVAATGERKRIERRQRQVAEDLLPLLHLEEAWV
jgi:hypothetical protein